MNNDTQNIINEIKQSIELLRRSLDWDNALKRLHFLNDKAENPNLWEKVEEAKILMRERQHLDNAISSLKALQNRLDDNVALLDLAIEENNSSVLQESLDNLKQLKLDTEYKQFESLFSGEADSNDVYFEVHAGAGGTESQDWANMLVRMYIRWSERRKFKIDLLEVHDGEEAGIKSATLLIKGPNAYGWLKGEQGVHRLVRISPYDSNSRRHTSFSSVWVYPVVDESIEIEINESDCRIDTYRASGAGGQHVNTTDSAVRITHIPTGVVVQCQQERSQHKNKAQAWNMLRAKLYDLELQKREEIANIGESSKTEIGWGRQIRSYVLQPYQMVKDLRTNIEKSSPLDVLNGDLDDFMKAALALKKQLKAH
ncbi:peptide chain release factor 2 [Candidatus Liberibacter solanacearum]|uniref:Peptide chain release factor 2 n=1 Tax=Candidatus Liberibacter solanacearum TaxID=556287 RepID=A0A3R7TJP6_9HYPH|nr:peptide chain release factor 2 [Candidatus Liberibacter solanacearum]RPD37769.1 peptide chain release factor 2 [Candidatus Liberibacter solanacearum]